MRHKVTDAGRRSSYGRLDVVCRTVVTIGGMEPGHGSQVLEDTVGQIAGAKPRAGVHGPLFGLSVNALSEPASLLSRFRFWSCPDRQTPTQAIRMR